MYEKVSPSHPDKIADRIAGALVDLAYTKEENPRIAVEVLIGHGYCTIIAESSVHLKFAQVREMVQRISGDQHILVDYIEEPQDEILAENQSSKIRCGDNGIFKGVPNTEENIKLTEIARKIYSEYPHDGKYIINGSDLVICHSNVSTDELQIEYPNAKINPLGDWTGGADVDTGATNRKLGSDMGDSLTGGGLHGKDLSKADVSVNIYAWIQAQLLQKSVEYYCAIGDETVNGVPYEEIVDIARQYIESIGGFEKFAEWGLIR